MKPSLKAIKVKHRTRLLAGSGGARSLVSSGWSSSDDAINLDEQGGDNNTWDR